MSRLNHGSGGDEVIGKGGFARPYPTVDGLAKSSLIVGVRLDAKAAGEPTTRIFEEARIVIEPMQGDDDCTRLGAAVRLPRSER